ncbi:AraC family ligand binding domain-containing protein [Lysinibacillus sp. NPDC093190]|uniref:AraC family ligand binding domain-containing protein n=1 Tax=Lysinibacillus sp. NPDC093190 TaxID=3390575 RepID=UPI003CFD3E8D
MTQKSPNHFHDYYVIRFIESAQRRLTCKNKEYIINTGDLICFNPLDNHACEQIDNKTLDYRCLNIKTEIIRKVTKEITGKDYLPQFKTPVVYLCEQTSILHNLPQMIMNKSPNNEKQETFFFIKQLIDEYLEPPQEEDNGPKKDMIQNICQYIEAHYKDRITLDDLARMANMNKYSLVRAFFLSFWGTTDFLT